MKDNNIKEEIEMENEEIMNNVKMVEKEGEAYRKRKSAITKLIVFLGSIALIVIVFFLVKGKGDTVETESHSAPELIGGTTFDAYYLELADAPSDIEGMTVLDKMQMGLYQHDGSDTDGDGLTDKEEIEIYGTDPLLASTSGDFLSDGYKVSHNLELTSIYDIADYEDATPEYLWEVPAGLLLEAKTLDDYNSKFRAITGLFDDYFNADNKWTVYKTYEIAYYHGNIAINLDDIECGENPEELTLLISNGYDYGSANEAPSHVEGNTIYLDMEDVPDAFLLSVVKKNSFEVSSVIDQLGEFNLDLSVTPYTPSVGLYSRALEELCKNSGRIYYVSCGNKEEDEANLERMCREMNKIIQCTIFESSNEQKAK